MSESRLDSRSIGREAIAELQRAIGFDRWCWVLADPQTLIPLGGDAEHDYGPAVARSLELEYSGTDFAAMGALARRTTPVASLSAETGGDLARSPRWDEVLRPVGIGDEAVLACRDALGCGVDQGLPRRRRHVVRRRRSRAPRACRADARIRAAPQARRSESRHARGADLTRCGATR
jgi:hypothetical protein